MPNNAFDDDLLFCEETEDASQPSPNDTAARQSWKIAIVDDEEEVHTITKMVLRDFEFSDRKLEFLSAFSAEEAKLMLEKHPDIAVLLLDVVMEHDHSGLEFVEYVRNELGNQNIRIVLRTGQPGQAPEQHVIARYDINDYKEKTELTSRKLFTLLYSCLRSYRDIIALERSRVGLENVINSSQKIFSESSCEQFARGVIEQITSLLYADRDAFFGKIDSLVTHENKNGIHFIVGTGAFEQCTGKTLDHVLPAETLEQLEKQSGKVAFFKDDTHYIAQMTNKNRERNILVISGVAPRNPMEEHMLELFCQNALIAFDNIHLRQEIEDTQRELVYRLGEAVETRSKETGNHVKRVAEISKLLALKSGLDEKRAEILKQASPMHDLGKIGIPDAVLNKPGKLDHHEWDIMRGHALIGYEMLASSEREILRLGGVISLEHHEKWDGSGYPHGKKGEEISIEGRITAIADVFDALASDRCYKKAWQLDEVLNYFNEQKGIHFDPELVDLLMTNLDQINEIRTKYRDDFD